MQMAMEYQEHHKADKEKCLIFSDFEQQQNRKETIQNFVNLISEKGIDKLISIGIDDRIKTELKEFDLLSYESTEDFIQNLDPSFIKDKCVLIKGARKYRLEQIFSMLSKQIHQTVLETDFSAMAHNLSFYRSKINTSTKLMAVIKAEAYGSGSVQVAKFLENQKIDYLAVALVDEAIKIREIGCQLPIMVFNVGHQNTEHLWKYNLEPEIYSLELLNLISQQANRLNLEIFIHIKVESGMNRLGFKEEDLKELIKVLKENKLVKVRSIFSHLAASDDSQYDSFSESQFDTFNASYQVISEAINTKPLRHILNTGGIIRFPEHQYEMVRLGLGIYGIDETHSIQRELENVHTLKSTIIQIKDLKAGETTGYNRSGRVQKDSRIAIVNIGYADGIFRLIGNGNYQPLVNGKACPTIGNICMDVCMIDISGYSNVNVGDEVVFFGKTKDIKDLAKACNTISYEIISRIAPRIKRLYIYN